MSHNIHGLLHIVDDYRKYGSLDKCSCFPFENYLKSFKKMVRKFEKPLEQVVKRYEEFLTFTEPKITSLDNKEIVFKKPHNDGPLVEHCSGPQFKIMIINNLKINIILVLTVILDLNVERNYIFVKLKIFLTKILKMY